MAKVLIFRGPSGSGKSTAASMIRFQNRQIAVVSADHYFMVDGEYKFDPKELPEAHAQCLREFTYMVNPSVYQEVACPEKKDIIIVDNTNIHAWEISPYYNLALAFGHDVEIINFHRRFQNVHGVPDHAVKRMHENMNNEKIPPFWKFGRIESYIS